MNTQEIHNKVNHIVVDFFSQENANQYIEFFSEHESLQKVENDNGSCSIVFEGSALDYEIFKDDLARTHISEIDHLEESEIMNAAVAEEIRLGVKKMNQPAGNAVISVEGQNTATKSDEKLEIKKGIARILAWESEIAGLNIDEEELKKQIEITQYKLAQLQESYEGLDKNRLELHGKINTTSSFISDAYDNENQQLVADIEGSKYLIGIEQATVNIRPIDEI